LCPSCEKTRDELAGKVDKKGKQTKKTGKSSASGPPAASAVSTGKLHCDGTVADGAAGVSHDVTEELLDTDNLSNKNKQNICDDGKTESTVDGGSAINLDIVVNELLAYVSFYLHRSNVDALRRITLSTFTSLDL
jgi:hypothetical protein